MNYNNEWITLGLWNVGDLSMQDHIINNQKTHHDI